MVHFGKYAGMRELALFAGAGGGILGGKMLGWRTVCAVEIEKYPRNVLLQRQRDGILDKFPIWDDVRTFDGRPWRGKVDVISGGFPCQDISSAGKGLGIERGERSGLWREYARIIRDVRPRYCFVENSPMLTVRGLGIVLGDLAERGYDAAWKVLSAGDCGAPHERARMWIVAKDTNAAKQRLKQGVCESCRQGLHESLRLGCEVADAVRDGSEAGFADSSTREERIADKSNDGCCVEPQFVSDAMSTRGRWNERQKEDEASLWELWWQTEPVLGRVADGVANRVDRLKAIGNGQVPIVAARAFCDLMEVLDNA